MLRMVRFYMRLPPTQFTLHILYSHSMHIFYLNVPSGTVWDIKWLLLEAILSTEQIYWAGPCTLPLCLNVLW